tara:strand:- start:134 stop:298 length:165 start_codon:yes stop_codon:yes gene_type:complete
MEWVKAITIIRREKGLEKSELMEKQDEFLDKPEYFNSKLSYLLLFLGFLIYEGL